MYSQGLQLRTDNAVVNHIEGFVKIQETEINLFTSVEQFGAIHGHEET